MRHYSILIVLIITALPNVWAQDFLDNFSDGNFNTEPEWTGNTESFIVNGSFELQLNGDCGAGGTHYLGVPFSTLDSVTWEFNVRCTFDPSTSNYARVYLQSDVADVSGDVNGYYVRIGGESGALDAVEIYRQEGATKTLILRGTDGLAAISPNLGIKVVRTGGAEWNLYVDATGGTDYVFEGSATDNTMNGGSYMGVVCTYTSTRCTSFYFDDFIAGPLYADTDAPLIQQVNLIEPETIEIIFNETVEQTSAENVLHYTVDGGVGNPIDATVSDFNDASVQLVFSSDFPQDVWLHLTISSISDLAGNILLSETVAFTYNVIEEFDVLINEIMADPNPVVSLPDAEYLELFNTTPFPVNIVDWFIADATGISDPFPAAIIPADSFILLTSDANVSLFSSDIPVVGVDGFPSLNNEGDKITLFNNTGVALHTVEYTSDWYQNPMKADGGYALEMIDAQNPCAGENNWAASNDLSGGTPGRKNSIADINPDNTPPMILNAFPIGIDTIVVQFDEPVLSASLELTSFEIDNGIGTPAEIILSGGIVKSVTLVLNISLSSNIVYTLTANGITDCSANGIMLGNTFQFGIPENAEPEDILINEVLFNPSTGGYDFVELYNNSNKLIDLASLYIVELSIDEPDVVLEFASIAETGRLFFPQSYIVLTANVAFVAEAYNRTDVSNFIEVISMPNYPDDEGIVLIQTKSFVDIDKLQFTDDWHFALLEDENGVSLERITFDGATQNAESWHSAAALLGYGTPGYQNSNYSSLVIADNLLDVEYSVFSPDGDGYQDLLIITYQTEQEGFVASIKIFDDAGRLIHTLINNETMAREGFITWDGVRSNGAKAPMGIYFLYAEFFNLDGVTQKQRKKFTLIRKY